jgi:DNA-binding phage protein
MKATSQMRSLLTEIATDEPISAPKARYLAVRTQLRLHDFLLRRFEIEKDKGLDQATIARRLGTSQALISRTLGVPGNWTIRTVAKIAAALGGEIDFTWQSFPKAESSEASEKTIAALSEQIVQRQKHTANSGPSVVASDPKIARRPSPRLGQ